MKSQTANYTKEQKIAFFTAAQTGDMNDVIRILQHHPRICLCKDDNGKTADFFAAQNNFFEVATLITNHRNALFAQDKTEAELQAAISLLPPVPPTETKNTTDAPACRKHIDTPATQADIPPERDPKYYFRSLFDKMIETKKEHRR